MPPEEGDLFTRYMDQPKDSGLYDRVPGYTVRAMKFADWFDDTFNKNPEEGVNNSKKESSLKETDRRGGQPSSGKENAGQRK